MDRFTRFAGAFALTAAVFSAPALAEGSPVIGTWDTKVESPMGEFAAKWTFASADAGYTLDIEPVAPEGAPADAAMEMAVSDLVVEEGNFSFTQTVDTPQGAMAIAVSGAVDGDALAAEAKTDFGNMPISGMRAE